MYQQNVIQHDQSSSANFIFEDLFVIKARNSYTRLINDKITLFDEKNKSHRLNHKFCFRFFLISIEHVNKINNIILKKSYNNSKIVFKSKFDVRKILKYYLNIFCEQNKTYDFKIMMNALNQSRFVYLKKLKQAIKQLSFNATIVYQSKIFEMNKKDILKVLNRNLSRIFFKKLINIIKLYIKLNQFMTMMKTNVILIICKWKYHNNI